MAGVITGLDDDALRDRVAEATARYFTDWSHPGSGMARERTGGAFGYDVEDTVTTGGTGFGLMAQVVAVERGWFRRQTFLDRMDRLVSFLETADRFEGVFPHFLSGRTGRVLPFSREDDGGDIVESAFLMSGLLVVAAYFRDCLELVARIDRLYAEVNWAAHVRSSDGAVMWHRHPDRPWKEHALALGGWNECLPVFVLGSGSTTFPLPTRSYHDVWANTPAFLNGQSYGGVTLPLGPDRGGPLFLSQYPFLAIDPRGLVDDYADYGVQARAHALVNRWHCLENSNGHAGYGPHCWGLTASDDPDGYATHAPDRDNGTITPTAALSSFPYCPEYSMPVLRHLHDDLGDCLWGEYGFYDAFCPSRNWVAATNLAIDQGPIVVGLENNRSGLIWKLGMSRPEIIRGLSRLGFRSPWFSAVA